MIGRCGAVNEPGLARLVHVLSEIHGLTSLIREALSSPHCLGLVVVRSCENHLSLVVFKQGTAICASIR